MTVARMSINLRSPAVKTVPRSTHLYARSDPATRGFPQRLPHGGGSITSAAAVAARVPPARPRTHRHDRRTASQRTREPSPQRPAEHERGAWASVARTSPSIVAYVEDEGKSES